MRVRCCTYFDITATGVKNHYRLSHGVFRDAAGNSISDTTTWNRARNQQRNWETVNQLISLRALPVEITIPVVTQEQNRNVWTFEFLIEQNGALTVGDDAIGALIQDSYMIPMLTGLDETPAEDKFLTADANIFFSVLPINNL
jgi:hypothetical protein